LVAIELFQVVLKMREENRSWVQVMGHLEHVRRMLVAVGKKWEQETAV
jgi:hypothetical protein